MSAYSFSFFSECMKMWESLFASRDIMELQANSSLTLILKDESTWRSITVLSFFPLHSITRTTSFILYIHCVIANAQEALSACPYCAG